MSERYSSRHRDAHRHLRVHCVKHALPQPLKYTFPPSAHEGQHIPQVTANLGSSIWMNRNLSPQGGEDILASFDLISREQCLQILQSVRNVLNLLANSAPGASIRSEPVSVAQEVAGE